MSTASPHTSAGTRVVPSEMSPAACASLLALVLLSTRFVQGFIFWGGASRRLFYDFHPIAGVDHAVKLDFDSAGFVAAKLVHALPGALFLQAPIEWTLGHPFLIGASVWFWTFAELTVGVGLIFGLLTRLAALGSLAINVVLMLIFGWMGSTCLDEWTMAVSGVAMSSAVFLAGGGTWSLDALVGRTPFAACNLWFPWIGSGALPRRVLSALGLLLAAVAMLFTVGSYHMLFGGVVSPLHARVNFHRHHLALSEVVVAPDGSVRFDADVDAGPDTGAAYLIAARLVDAAGAPVATWDGEALKSAAITNVWPYVWASRFEPQTIGFSAATGARATITLPVPADADLSGDGALTLVLEAINGATWQQPARFETTTGFGTAAGAHASILPRTPTIIERIRNGIRTPVHEAINAAT